MVGGMGRSESRTGSSASRLSYGQWISWDSRLKVSLSLLRAVCVCVCAALLCLHSDLSGLQGGGGGGGEGGCQVQQ